MPNGISGFEQPGRLINILEATLYRGFGLKAEVGIEVEFYLHNCLNIEKFITLYGNSIIPERGKGQYEINLKPSPDLVGVCDSFHCHKDKLSSVATSLNQLIDFNSKPIKEDYGSSVHYHLSLHDDNGCNIFGIEDNTHIMESVVASILELTNQSLYMLTAVNDFDRFVPHFMAPVNISWGGNNRTTLLRIPNSPKANKRIEFRLPSSNAAPELVIIFLLTATLEGLKNKKKPIEKIYGNAYDKQYRLTPLLANLIEAKKCFRFIEIIANYTSDIY